jgi:hypothetical protein
LQSKISKQHLLGGVKKKQAVVPSKLAISVALGPEMMREEEIDSQMFDRDIDSVGRIGSLQEN